MLTSKKYNVLEVKIEAHLHKLQLEVLNESKQFNVVSCGRRLGKTFLSQIILLDCALNQKQPAAYCAPTYEKYVKPFQRDFIRRFKDIIDSSSAGNVVRLKNGVEIEFYSLNDKNAGRGRKYGVVVCDEAGQSDIVDSLDEVWQFSLSPTLLDYNGKAYFLSTPTGIENNFHDLYLMEKQYPEYWKSFTAPTSENPHVPKSYLDIQKSQMHPDVFNQEYLAEFINWNLNAFYKWDWFTEIEDKDWSVYDQIFMVSDTAIKDGENNDGTAYMIAGTYYENGNLKFDILDYDKRLVNANLIEEWLIPIIEDLKNRFGSKFAGCAVEDKGSGQAVIMNLQQVFGALVFPLQDKHWTGESKVTRAMSTSKYIYRGDVKVSRFAVDKQITFKDKFANHFRREIVNFIANGGSQEDDLIDCLNYLIILIYRLNKQDAY